MPHCRVCHKALTNLSQPCPRCGFLELSFVGDPEVAEQKMNQMADKARVDFLSQFEFGVNVYHWKDKDGQIALDHRETLFFGSGDNLLDKTLWLEQLFARIPDLEQMELELEILRSHVGYRVKNVAVPVPKGNHLQQVGISLTRDMQVHLLLKNPQEQTRSVGFPFLID